MIVPWLVATLHLLALGIGLGSIWARGSALRSPLDAAGLRRVFLSDHLWGVAGFLWLVTGLFRAFGGLDKPTAYYLSQGLFHAKLGLFVLVLALEVTPMIALIRWRRALRRQEPLDTSMAPRLATISRVQALLVVVILTIATALARGVGFTP